MAKTSGNVDVLLLGIRALLGTDGSSGMVVQSQVKRERNLIFSTLQMVVQKPEMIKAMGTEFVLGFIQAVDGEKDPTNLMMIFQVLYKKNSNWIVGQPKFFLEKWDKLHSGVLAKM